MRTSFIQTQEQEQEQLLTREQWQKLEAEQKVAKTLKAVQERKQKAHIERLAKQMLSPCFIQDGPNFPNPKRGLAGLKEADRILKKKGLVGILIGGLGCDLYSDEAPEDALAKLDTHKDVDVLVLPDKLVEVENKIQVRDTSKCFKKFEGGIDWWHLRVDIENYDTPSHYYRQQRIYNGNDILSFFVLNEACSVPSQTLAAGQSPGLYILPQRVYDKRFLDQKEAEMSRLHPDFEKVRYDVVPNIYRIPERPLIPQIAELFPMPSIFSRFDSYRKRKFCDELFWLDEQAFNKMWDRNYGTLEAETKRRDKLRQSQEEATTEDEKLAISKELQITSPNRKMQAEKLRNLRDAHYEYLEALSKLRGKIK